MIKAYKAKKIVLNTKHTPPLLQQLIYTPKTKEEYYKAMEEGIEKINKRFLNSKYRLEVTLTATATAK